MKDRKLGPVAWIAIGCGAVFFSVLAFVAFIVFVTFGSLRSSTPYKTAVALAQNDERVIAALGKPIRTGYLFQGSLNTANGNSDATYSIPLRGPKGGAILDVKAQKKMDGAWRYDVIKVTVKDQTIDLLKISE
ncbi:MAG TPA: cytochrome c oxidase assembly factor Coa1 family protein [Thermoanaerobaculia bacterium]|nr:cytochrome c oxidase assembly factor Coa1 family protein [Thermoanaerobaculia bacterium]